jgi:hypothetical protein
LDKTEITEDWRKFHNMKLQNSYSPSDIIKMFTSTRANYAEHIVITERRGVIKILGRKTKKWTSRKI